MGHAVCPSDARKGATVRRGAVSNPLASRHVFRRPRMDSTVSTLLVLAVVAVLGYFLVMRVFFRDSKALDGQIDHSKMKEWKDEDD
jgi:hypothetical protein